MIIDLSKYIQCVVKVLNVYNNTEIYGYLMDYDKETGYIKLNRPIISVNKFLLDGAGTMHSIIKYNYNEKDGNVVTLPLATVYPNDGTENNVIYLNLNAFVLVPLYDSSYLSEKKLDKNLNIVHIKTTFENYIDFVYTTYSEMLYNNINTTINETEI